MIDPGLPPVYFASDLVLHQKQIHGPAELSRIKGAEPGPDGIVFRSAGRLNITLDRPFPDFSAFNRLSLRISNNSPTLLLIGLRLIHESPPLEKGPEWISFSGGREPLAPGVRRDLKFPVESFGSYGHPSGWADIRRILIHITPEKTETRILQVTVTVHSLWAEKIKVPAGPRLSQRGLKALTSDLGGLTDYFQKKGLFHYTWPGFRVPPPHGYPRDTAREVLAGRIMGQQMERLINWLANPLGQLEWTHFLNRHHFLRPLVKAWAAARDPAHPKAVDRIIRSWITQNPAPLETNGGAGPTWETLTVAWRLREWFWIAGLIRPTGHFSAETRNMMLRSIWEHAESLLHHQGHPNNWLIVESAALALAGMCFPFFPRAATWVGTGLERLAGESRRQFFNDGGHFEISTLYQAICISALLDVKQTAKAVETPLPAGLDDRLIKSIDHLAGLVRPDFTWPSINDSGGMGQDYTPIFAQAGELFDRPDFAWLGSRGQKGAPPSGGMVRVFPDSGLAVMRSGYSPGDSCLFFRAGPAGATHVHEDILSLDLTVHGVVFLVDPGITAYAPTPLTEHYRSARSHNTILLEENAPRRITAGFAERTRPAGTDLSLEQRGRLEILTGFYCGPWLQERPEVRLCRRIIWVDRRYWIVWDYIEGPEQVRLRIGWQLALDKADIDFNSQIIQMARSGSSLALVPLPGPHRPDFESTCGQKQPPGGWVSVNGKDIPAIHAYYSLKASPPLGLAWLLYPGVKSNDYFIQAGRKDEKPDRTVLTIECAPGLIDRIRLGPPELEVEHQWIEPGG